MVSVANLRVQIRQGVLEGRESEGIHSFLGIPYAAPPIGPRRWRPPEAPESWSGVRAASQFGPAAIQTVGAGFMMRAPTHSEDCLNINVWTRSLEPTASQPVMVWIHGGGNLGGAGSEDAFDGHRLAAKGVTVVTFNYRLGAFGFLAHPSLGANFAVLDYVATLEWVRDNISSFGGDPGCVTIFGESAGAVAVRTLLSTPRAHGLFHRAIFQSAGFERFAFAPGWSYDRAEAAAGKLFDRIGTREPRELRAIPTETLRVASHELSGIFPPPGRVHTPANLVWMPVTDGVIVQDNFSGWPADVPVMFGCLENEARYFIRPGGQYGWDLVSNMAAALCGSNAEQAVSLLKCQTEDAYDAIDRLFSTVIWFEPAFATAKRLAALGRRFYYYHFARVSPGALRTQELVKHSAEIRYVFGNLTDDGCYDETDRIISEAMQGAWIEFARSGVPKGPDSRQWPAFSTDAAQMSWIGDTFETRSFHADDLTCIVNSLRSGAS